MPKTAVTIRLDETLLTALRQRAVGENRTLTNLIETVLKHAVDAAAAELRTNLPLLARIDPTAAAMALAAAAASQPIIVPPQDDGDPKALPAARAGEAAA